MAVGRIDGDMAKGPRGHVVEVLAEGHGHEGLHDELALGVGGVALAVDQLCIAEVVQGVRFLQARNLGPQAAHILAKRTDALPLLHNGAVALHDGTNKC